MAPRRWPTDAEIARFDQTFGGRVQRAVRSAPAVVLSPRRPGSPPASAARVPHAWLCSGIHKLLGDASRHRAAGRYPEAMDALDLAEQIVGANRAELQEARAAARSRESQRAVGRRR